MFHRGGEVIGIVNEVKAGCSRKKRLSSRGVYDAGSIRLSTKDFSSHLQDMVNLSAQSILNDIIVNDVPADVGDCQNAVPGRTTRDLSFIFVDSVLSEMTLPILPVAEIVRSSRTG